MPKVKRPRSKGKPPARLDVYEAEEEVPDEEKYAGQRYDNPDNYEYELPSDFEDEEIDEDAAFTEEDKKLYAGWFEGTEATMAAGGNAASDDGLLDSQDDAEDGEDAYDTDDFSEEEDAQAAQERGEEAQDGRKESDESSEEEDDMGEGGQEQHERMLAEVRAAGRPAGARRPREVQTESVPERALNVGPMTGMPGGQAGELQISDLLGALGKGRGRNVLDARSRRTLERVEKRSAPVEPSLPATIRAKKQRQAGYEVSTKDVSKWQSIVKANREAPTLKFAAGNEDVPRTSTTGALIAKFQPSRDFEKEIAAMLAAAGAHNEQAVQEAEEALALKGQSAEEARARRDHLAKMRSLLFHQEAKLKHLAKIKSKDYHRRAQKAARAKAKKAGEMGDANFLRLAAEEAELKRAKERLTLKHRSTSQWARRALRRGINVMDEGTKEAIQEQLRMGQQLRRKVEAPGSGSDMGSGAEDSATDALDDDGDAPEDLSKPSRAAVAKAKATAVDIMQSGDGEGDAPAKGLFALPFMRRAQEKRRAQAQAEAAAMLRDMEAADAGAELDSGDEAATWAAAEPSAGRGGRLRFGGGQQQQNSHLDDEGDSEAEVSDADEDGEAKAERLTSQVEPPEGALPVSASGWTAASAGPPACNAEGAGGSHSQKDRKTRKQISRLESKGMAEESVLANGSAQKGGLLQSGSASADAASNAKYIGHEAYRPDVLAHVARKQREHLLNGKIGAIAQNGAAEQHRGKQAALPASQTAGQENGRASGRAPFVQASAFRGPREGYAFKTGPRGTGYYQEGPLRGEQQSSKADGAQRMPSKSSSKARPRQKAPEPAGGDQQDDGNMKPLKGTELSQRELIARAFAGDDVQAEFDEAKGQEAEEEAPKADAPSLLPGWGAWAGHQKMSGWMAKAQDKAQRQRQEAIAKRKDAKLAHVIISERYDKKASKYGAPSVPFPYNAKEVYERSMRQPLGRDYNTDSSFRNMTRPKILKTPGVVIEPLKYNKAADKEAARQPANNARRKSMAVVSNGMRKQSRI